MRNTNKGFTLVELIVVITILAILGTIAFISLGSYTADARNSKRLDGISKIATAVDNGLIGGSSILAFSTDSANQLSPLAVGGTGSVVDADYNAGAPNATALKINIEQFQDPSTATPYPIAVARAAGGVFETAATVEEGSARRAKVIGNYTPRKGSSTGSIVVNGPANGSGSGTTKAILASVSDINFFKTGDIVSGSVSGTDLVVQNISSDGNTITLSDIFTGTELYLSVEESTGLMMGFDTAAVTGTGTVTNDGTTFFPYLVQ